MGLEQALPCRHAGVPLPAIIDKVRLAIESLGTHEEYLAALGLTADEYRNALPLAIEQIRGSKSASSGNRREFMIELLESMRARDLIDGLQTPDYGKDTVYRLSIAHYGDVAVIQKGCPDGAHSSVRWTQPDWARETYLWWMCSSLSAEPGEHVAKGVNRLRQRFFSETPGVLDGVIFFNEICGTPLRPCPKSGLSAYLGERPVPPPSIFVMPDRVSGSEEWNWDGARKPVFPGVLLSMFGIENEDAAAYTGHVGFRRRGADIRTTITSRFGPGRSTTYRS